MLSFYCAIFYTWGYFDLFLGAIFLGRLFHGRPSFLFFTLIKFWLVVSVTSTVLTFQPIFLLAKLLNNSKFPFIPMSVKHTKYKYQWNEISLFSPIKLWMLSSLSSRFSLSSLDMYNNCLIPSVSWVGMLTFSFSSITQPTRHCGNNCFTRIASMDRFYATIKIHI